MANQADWSRRLNKFYAAQYAWILRMLNFLLIGVVAAFAIILYLDYTKPRPTYYQAAADGSIMRLYPLYSPMMGPRALRDWATQVAVSAYTYNFADYEERFTETASYFTPKAWSAFYNSLIAANVLDDTVTKKLIVSAVASGATVITDRREIAGYWTWLVQVPLLVTYRSGGISQPRDMIINMLITRVPAREVPQGIAVAQFYSQVMGGDVL